MFKTSDSQLVAYLLFKGRDVAKMEPSPEEDGIYEFFFHEDDEIKKLASQFPLTSYKRFIQIYREVIDTVKKAQSDGR